MKNKIIKFILPSCLIVIVPFLIIIILLGSMIGSSSDKRKNGDGTISDEKYFEKIKWTTLDETGEYDYLEYSNQDEDKIENFKKYNTLSFDLKKEDLENATLDGITFDTLSDESRTIYYRTMVFETGYDLPAFIKYNELSEEEKSSIAEEDIPIKPIYMSDWQSFGVRTEIESVSLDVSIQSQPENDICVIVYFNDIPNFITYSYDEGLNKNVPSNTIENQFGFDELYLFMFEKEGD